MSDRRAVSAGHLGASSVAAASEPWRVAVGGNRVQSMTIEQIAHAFHAGQLTVRTPLWPPGTSGWQALGNFEQFQLNPAYAGASNGQLSQFDEAEDDPTRMWTGSADLELDGMQQYMPAPPPPARPSSQTGPRQVSSRAPRPAVASQPVRYPVTASVPAKRASRGNGLMLIAGLVGLVGLGSAVLAARSNWSLIAPSGEAAPQASLAPDVPGNTGEAAPATAPIEPPSAQPGTTNVAAAAEASGAQLAKYDDTSASAFVAGAEGVEAAKEEAPASPASAELAKDALEKSRAEEPAASTRSKTSAKATPRRTLASAPKPRPRPESRAVAKAEPKAEPKAESQEQPPAASASVNEAAAAALGTSATLASSCRPRGGPSGPGKARIIYSNDGDVQSVEILTAKFRDTLTGSCVRMVFRRAKIPPFKGEPPTFIKSFTIPEE